MYKITKQQANTIGRFEYKPNHFFSPFEREQYDGSYLVSVQLVDELKDNVNIKKINWNNVQIISQYNDKKYDLLETI